MTELLLQLLGQSGCRFEINGTVIYMDPYLSNSVQELDAPDLERLVPIPIQPEDINDADLVVITHHHIDHCDPHTLPLIAQASVLCRFIGPPPVLKNLQEWGISAERCDVSSEEWQKINDDIRIKAVPAAHPIIERDANDNLLTVGYVLDLNGNRIYLAGDTFVTDELIESLMSLRPINMALLPVNEHNFYRERRGIIGNMSIREAFLLAQEVGIKTVIPVHWDMFAANSVSLDEIKAVYQLMKPGFELQFQSTSITF